jgi:hypothetical protein
MPDLVGTCPKDFWDEWIAEGDASGDPETGEEWSWETRHPLARAIHPGDRLYVVAHAKLRGYAIVTRVTTDSDEYGYSYSIIRKGNAVACTIDEPIPGFRGIRFRWWQRDRERLFPEWKTP